MQGFGSVQYLLAAALTGAALLCLSLALCCRRKSLNNRCISPAPRLRHAYYQLDVRQLERIRTLLGLSVAKAVLDHLAIHIERAATMPASVLVGEMSLQIVVSHDEGAPMEQAIASIMAALPQTISVAGVTLAVTVKERLLFDTAVDSYSAAGRAHLASGFLRAHDGVEAGRNIALIKEFTEALHTGALSLAYQPKLDVRNNTIPSVEALLRWTRDDGSEANIAELITLLEDTGSIAPLTFWALQQAVRDTTIMHQSGFPIRTFVNVSGSLLSSTDFANAVIGTVHGHADKVGIEITETAVIADPDMALRSLEAIAAAGIFIAIDDFGSGVCSLEYLQRLPANELKIDRNFVGSLSTSHRNPLIVKATIDLAHALEMKVTAEGVEDQLSLALLRVMGCDMVQGYLVARPIALEELLKFLENTAAATGGAVAVPVGSTHADKKARPTTWPQTAAPKKAKG